jgi:probable F420-dependent oxidoreductase
MRISYGPWGETIGELVEAARAAEDAGAEIVWVPEMHRSATVTAAAVAQATTTARVGTAIALAFTRSPMVTALEALDLDELSDGRFVLGLGTGVKRLNEDWHNAQWGKPAPHLREVVRDVRAFWELASTGDPIVVEGEYEPMRIRGYKRPFFQARPSVPVYLGAMGPVMTRLVGEIGDGWISHELISPRFLEANILPELRTGLERGGRERESLDVVVSALCAIDVDGSAARRWAAGTVGFYASVRTYADFFDFHGYGVEHAAVVDAFRSGTGTGADGLGDLCPDGMVDAVTLAGTADEVRERIAAFEGVADTIKLTPPTHGVDASVTRRCQEQIIDLIRSTHHG